MARNISENFGRIYVKELIIDQDGKIEIIGNNNVSISNDISNIVLPETLSGSITGNLASFNQLTASFIFNNDIETNNIFTNYISGTYLTSTYIQNDILTSSYIKTINLNATNNISASNKIETTYLSGAHLSGNGFNIWNIQATNVEGLDNAVKNRLEEGAYILLESAGGGKTRISVDTGSAYITINSVNRNPFKNDAINVGTITSVTGNNGISGSATSGQALLTIDNTYVVTIDGSQLINGQKTFNNTVTASNGISGTFGMYYYLTGTHISGNGQNIWNIQADNIVGLSSSVKSNFIEGSGIKIVDLGAGNKSLIKIDSDTVATITSSQNITGIKTFSSILTASSGITSSYIVTNTITSNMISGASGQYTVITSSTATGSIALYNIITGSKITSSMLNSDTITASIAEFRYLRIGQNSYNNSTLNLSGSISYNILSTGSANLTLDDKHNIIYVTSELTCTLPTASLYPGRTYIFKRPYAYNLLITCSNSDVIENFSGSITLDSLTHNETVTLISDGINNWIILNYISISASNDAGINRIYVLGQ